jgi:hypothetical protein
MDMTTLIRTQLMLREDQREELSRLAEEINSSVSEVIRDLIDSQLRIHRLERMRKAANELRADYASGGSLDMTELDGEDFIDA